MSEIFLAHPSAEPPPLGKEQTHRPLDCTTPAGVAELRRQQRRAAAQQRLHAPEHPLRVRPFRPNK